MPPPANEYAARGFRDGSNAGPTAIADLNALGEESLTLHELNFQLHRKLQLMGGESEESRRLLYESSRLAVDVIPHAALLLRLLEGEATTDQLRRLPARGKHANKYLRAELSQPTISRYLTRLADVGLAGPGRKPKTYQLVHPPETRRFLVAVNGLALAIDRARTGADEALSQDLDPND